MPYKKRSRSDEYVASSQDRETNNDQNVEPMTAKSNKRTKAPRKVTHKAVKIVNVAYAEANERGEKIPITKLERHKKGKDDFTAIAWNVDSLRALLNHNVQELIDLCKEEQPNVIGFMNIRLSDEEMCEQCDQLLRAAVENILGPVETVWNRCTAKKGYSGTAMIVRKSVGKFDSKLGISDHADPEGRTITLEFDDMVVVLCYVPNSGHGLYRLAYRTSGRRCFDAELAEYCKSFDKPTLLLGDMNVADRDVDIWNVDKPYIPKKSGTTNEERESFREHYTSKGFTDTFAHMHPHATGCFSYWSVRARDKPRNRGLRLDYVISAPGFPIDRIEDAFILEDFAPHGNHCPVGVTFERPLKRQ